MDKSVSNDVNQNTNTSFVEKVESKPITIQSHFRQILSELEKYMDVDAMLNASGLYTRGYVLERVHNPHATVALQMMKGNGSVTIITFPILVTEGGNLISNWRRSSAYTDEVKKFNQILSAAATGTYLRINFRSTFDAKFAPMQLRYQGFPLDPKVYSFDCQVMEQTKEGRSFLIKIRNETTGKEEAQFEPTLKVELDHDEYRDMLDRLDRLEKAKTNSKDPDRFRSGSGPPPPKFIWSEEESVLSNSLLGTVPSIPNWNYDGASRASKDATKKNMEKIYGFYSQITSKLQRVRNSYDASTNSEFNEFNSLKGFGVLRELDALAETTELLLESINNIRQKYGSER